MEMMEAPRHARCEYAEYFAPPQSVRMGSALDMAAYREKIANDARVPEIDQLHAELELRIVAALDRQPRVAAVEVGIVPGDAPRTVGRHRHRRTRPSSNVTRKITTKM